MANTTDLVITCAGEDEIINQISASTGIDFQQITDSKKCGGDKDVWFESYAACYRCLGDEKITEVINAFKSARFTFPELAVLIIYDDNSDKFNGVHTKIN
ncbi:hypothetical protein ABXZ88_003222 [Vibrio fluvialis]